jgi:hypothetical protein
MGKTRYQFRSYDLKAKYSVLTISGSEILGHLGSLERTKVEGICKLSTGEIGSG